MKEYVIEVPYSYYDDMREFHGTVEYDVFAKSEEQARHRAKQYVRKLKPVSGVGSTTLIEENEI